MSEISSSPSVAVEGGTVPRDGVSAVGAAAADVLPANTREIPAAPHEGRAIVRRFRFEARFTYAIAKPPFLSGPHHTSAYVSRNCRYGSCRRTLHCGAVSGLRHADDRDAGCWRGADLQ